MATVVNYEKRFFQLLRLLTLRPIENAGIKKGPKLVLK
jgi:hypothetical protein